MNAKTQDNIVFLKTKILNELFLNSHSLVILFYCIMYRTVFKNFFTFKSLRPLKTTVQAVESLNFFNIFSQRTFLTL